MKIEEIMNEFKVNYCYSRCEKPIENNEEIYMCRFEKNKVYVSGVFHKSCPFESDLR